MIRNRWMGRLFVFVTLGAISSAGCFVVDDNKDDDGGAGEDSGGTGGSGGSNTKGGNAGTNSGGKSTGGEAGTGGGSTGGVSGSSAGGASNTGGVSGTGGSTGDAVVKFCNNLVKGDADVTLTVDFEGVRLSALTGTCSPVVGMDCATIRTGTDVTANLYDGSTLLSTASIDLLEAGDQVIALAVLGDDGYPTLDGGVVTDGSACSSWDFSDFFTAALEAKSFDFSNKSSKSLRAFRGLNAQRVAGFSELPKLY